MNEDTPPPPPPPDGADPAAPADPENLFAVALAKNNNDSFPVLNAFQTFLDQERERARRRVVTMAVCFTGAMVVMLLVFGILFATFFSRMMVSNVRQQDRLLDLVARGIPAAVHEAGYAAPADGSEGVSRREVLELLQQMSETHAPAGGGAAAAPRPLPAGIAPVPAAAPQGAPAPSTVIPSSVVPYGSQVAAGVAVPASPARDDLVASPPPRTGVISSPFRRDQQIKEAAEDAARRARLDAVRAAEAQAVAQAAPVPPDDLAEGSVPPAQAAAASRDDLAEGSPAVPATVPAPAVQSASAPAGPLPFALPAGASPTAAVEPVPLGTVALAASAGTAGTAAKAAAGRHAIAVKPKSRMSVPDGFSTDRAEVETASGSRIPFRVLVPVPDASR